jgi:hypothetical protein
VFSKPQPAVLHRGVPQPDKVEIASNTSAASVTNRPHRPQSCMGYPHTPSERDHSTQLAKAIRSVRL